MYSISTPAHSTAGDETKDGRGIQGRAETAKEGGDLRFLVGGGSRPGSKGTAGEPGISLLDTCVDICMQT